MEHTRTGSKQLLRDLNQNIVLNYIAMHGPVSRTEVAQESGLPAATVTRITRRFIDAQIVSEVVSEASNGGRPPLLLSFNPGVGHVVGVKLREDSLTLALCDLNGAVSQAQDMPFSSEGEPYQAIASIAAAIEQFLRDQRVPMQRVLGVGVGLSGLIDSARGMCRYSAILGWRDVDIGPALEYKLRVPVRVDNDVNTLAVAERLFGAGREGADFVIITIGRGIGLGLVLKGEIFRGYSGGAGEFGHITMDMSPDAPRCNCGKRGCLEAIASDYGILQAAFGPDHGYHVEDAMNDLIARVADDASIAALFAHAGRTLGVAIANLINIFDPKHVVVSGEGVRAGTALLEPMRATIPQHTFGRADAEIPLDVRPSNEQDWARGAATLILREVFQPPIYASQDALIMENLLLLAQQRGKRVPR